MVKNKLGLEQGSLDAKLKSLNLILQAEGSHEHTFSKTRKATGNHGRDYNNHINL